MCEVRATARSCSTGLSRTGTAPHSRARASTSSTASGSDLSCGVTAHGRPSKSAALAASGPERSLPAIGCPPTYRSTPGTSATAASGPDFTLPTSVTTASDPRSASAITSPRWSGGTATTTSCGRSASVRGRPAPMPDAVRTWSDDSSLSSTSSPARRAARPTEAPRSPAPITSIGP